MWVGGHEGRGHLLQSFLLAPKASPTLPFLSPLPQVLGEFSPVFPLPHALPGVQALS